MKTSSTPTLPLTAAFRSLIPSDAPQFAGVLLDPAGVAIATDGGAIAILPFPPGFAVERQRFIPAGDSPLEADPAAGSPLPENENWGWEAVEEMASASPPVYRIHLEPARLLALAEAMGAGTVILEFGGPESPVKVSAEGCPARGYIMPAGGEGLLVASPAAVPTGPPVITTSKDRGTLEITFPGRPGKEILEVLKDPAMAFRYSGEKGTRRGVPPRTWYGPNNPFTRETVSGILGTQIAA